LAAWDYETVRIDVLTETTKAFLKVLAAQEQLVLAEELVGVAEDVLASVSRRVKAGSTSPVEENRARVELETSRIDQDQISRALAAARKQLSATWGGTTPAFSVAAGSIEDVHTPPSLEVLQTRVEQTPILARWASELDHRRAALEFERSRNTPNLSLGAGVRYFRETEGAAFVVELALPIPIFDRNQGASMAAVMRVRQAEEGRRATATRIQAQLAVSHETLLAAESEVLALRDRALPESETAFQTAQDAYLRGSMRFTDVLDTKRLLFELKSRYFEALVRYHSAVADIERLTGESLETARNDSGRP
jgi:cobalt-zinc-cadmium efflux system outer membrane protein